ncbi:aminotransferase class I/II-fold pyridoxal phosphate-dependent enzyme [Pullulanibacillus sp. KACC 23026]|uniref:aminotransferase class I/II-fold pyridoxal phosphate-dependent enzyme n=1 Tax=Pullulanibacillus sp. KACC 23026 TaxID=3028315 RepID=UPI0023AEC34C|nr:aminotransferase class I/II-fold pyridoxal phosphate-dependent enzyme [Pullulanibacillus sp. KACC 23026]WEG11719.1 aminotransferase class I/II-fold pyridoxal phosphate-dependent enzyme [Pullulanibacillus sp. KACC 23026]
MSQQETPLFTGLVHYIKNNPIPFHIPGHKKGNGMDPEFREFIGENALKIDLINIAPLDDLHQPHGMIQQAQKLAAEAFGADETFFSVQGTSGAIMTMVLAVCSPGDKILVPRNVHKSVLSAIIFSGALPIFIYPEVDRELGISHGISTEAVKHALQAHPDAKALLVINPTYFGVSANLKEIVEVAHGFNVPVLVDEAHGIHIHFHEKLPMSAMQAGADMSATSIHKLGGSLTQSSVLNVKRGRVSPQRVQAVLSMLTTTSTSYILLASLDAARRHLATEGHKEISRAIELADHARNQINQIEGLYSPGEEILHSKATTALDPTKVLISVKKLGIKGYDAEVWLRENYRIEVELSDLYNILCLVTSGDDEASIQSLINGLRALSDTFKQNGKDPIHKEMPVHVPQMPKLALSPRDAFYAQTEFVPYEESVGRIIAEFVMVYPPGIPIFTPGEIITKENLDYIKENMDAGLPVQGPEDPALKTLKVVQEIAPIE